VIGTGTDEEGKCNKLRGWQIRGPKYWQVVSAR
jgi:hypothetical protein